MKLEVKRFEFGTNYTIGRMYVDGVFKCFTLEDKVRDVKVFGETAIPEGIYTVVLDESTRFGRKMPHVLNVPGFEGIRIHSGNTDKDTEGCILVGMNWAGGDFIGQSRVAFTMLYDKMVEAEATKESITVEVGNAVEAREK